MSQSLDDGKLSYLSFPIGDNKSIITNYLSTIGIRLVLTSCLSLIFRQQKKSFLYCYHRKGISKGFFLINRCLDDEKLEFYLPSCNRMLFCLLASAAVKGYEKRKQ